MHSALLLATAVFQVLGVFSIILPPFSSRYVIERLYKKRQQNPCLYGLLSLSALKSVCKGRHTQGVCITAINQIGIISCNILIPRILVHISDRPGSRSLIIYQRFYAVLIGAFPVIGKGCCFNEEIFPRSYRIASPSVPDFYRNLRMSGRENQKYIYFYGCLKII